MHVRRLATHVGILAPAKINLFLEVLSRRADGFHEIETLLATITAFDRLIFVPQTGAEISLEVRWGMGLAAREIHGQRSGHVAHELLYGEIPCGADNLAWRATALLRERAAVNRGAIIRLIKRIPAAAGLGGASTDAAAALMAANEAWDLHWPRSKLAELAAEIGSDVPFFFTSGAAVCRGRGEQIEPARLPRLHVVVVRPPVGLRTPEVYKICRPTDEPVGVRRLMTALARGDCAAVGRYLLNDLEPAAKSLTPWIRTLETEFRKHHLPGHQMSGSGSSYFGLGRSARHARRVAGCL